MEEDDSLI